MQEFLLDGAAEVCKISCMPRSTVKIRNLMEQAREAIRERRTDDARDALARCDVEAKRLRDSHRWKAEVARLRAKIDNNSYTAVRDSFS